MKKDGAMRLVISPSEARSLLNYLQKQGETPPEWAQDWDGDSSIWLPDVEEDEQDSDLCPVCQDFPIPEFNGCSCWYCPCMTTNPSGLMVCSCGQIRPSDIESVTRRLVAMVNRMERVPAWNRGEVATLEEAIDLLRTHALGVD